MLGGRRKAGTTEKGPNYTSSVVWALGVCFFLIRAFFILISVLFYVYRFYSTKYATERKMGHADDENRPKRLIQRRLGPRCVFFCFVVFYILISVFFYVYRFYSMKYATEREMRRTGDENRPKQLIQRCLGPRCVIFLFVVFYILINVLFYVFRFYSTKYATEGEMGHADDENQPKHLSMHY